MNAQVLVLRPEPGASATMALAQELGLAAVCAPMAQVVPCPWQVPPQDSFDALLLGSANAVRHAGPALATMAGTPALVVGDATAATARAAGLEVAIVGQGGLQAVLDGLRDPAPYARLLRLAGADHVPLNLPAGVQLHTRIVYRVEYTPLLPAALAALREGAVVLLHAGEAASHFARECDRYGIDRAALRLAALAPRIAQSAGTGWAALSTASAPTDGALLELAREMCQEHGNGA